MFAGLARGTITTRAFRVKTTGFEQSLSAYSCRGRAMFAEAKTSAGAPWRICAARVLEPANEYRAAGAILGKAFVRDAAAYTVSVAFEDRGTSGCAEAAPTASGVRPIITATVPSFTRAPVTSVEPSPTWP